MARLGLEQVAQFAFQRGVLGEHRRVAFGIVAPSHLVRNARGRCAVRRELLACGQARMVVAAMHFNLALDNGHASAGDAVADAEHRALDRHQHVFGRHLEPPVALGRRLHDDVAAIHSHPVAAGLAAQPQLRPCLQFHGGTILQRKPDRAALPGPQRHVARHPVAGGKCFEPPLADAVQRSGGRFDARKSGLVAQRQVQEQDNADRGDHGGRCRPWPAFPDGRPVATRTRQRRLGSAVGGTHGPPQRD